MRRVRIGLLAAALLLLPAWASAQQQEKVGVPEDLFAVITLRGKPCGKVKSYERRGESDYEVVCETGHRYRVYVNEQQRVIVEER
jgi:hypothetical protein